jgi:hypothetical protein
MRSIGLSLALLLAACGAPAPSHSLASSPARPSAVPETRSTAPSATPGPVSRPNAVDIARAADPRSAERELRNADFGPAGELAEGGYGAAEVEAVPPDRWVWVVVLHDFGPSGEGWGSITIIDYYTGQVLDSSEFVE